ncbi:MAG: alpha/beta fold hydrolase [Elusimicrobia bacterium]|nr:alpha/beta fold hydrolase [Elusimicrobiota bacterium]
MEIRAVKFRVGHEWRVGGLRLSPRAEKSPAVLLLHGFPGLQKNDDVAAELCRRGMTAFTPHFRGCWGSGGRYSLRGLLDDARASLRLLSRYHHVDAGRVAVLGVSIGGWVALKLAAETRLAAAVVMAPALPRLDEPADAAYLRRNGKVLNIPDFGEVWREYAGIARHERPDIYLRDIAPTPLLVMQGLQDRMVPPASARRLWALAGRPKELLELPGEGHEFENDRPAVVAAACDWLQARLAAGRDAALPELVDVGGGD